MSGYPELQALGNRHRDRVNDNVVGTEYAVQLTWPDGTVETSDPAPRGLVEAQARSHNGAMDGRRSTATVVYRSVSPWWPLNGVTAHGSEPGA